MSESGMARLPVGDQVIGTEGGDPEWQRKAVTNWTRFHCYHTTVRLCLVFASRPVTRLRAEIEVGGVGVTGHSSQSDCCSSEEHEEWPTFDLGYIIEVIGGVEYVYIEAREDRTGFFSPWIAIDRESAVPFDEIP
ncbi:hypothetical protein [Haladaptatus halobius]|uniref:hypothetical protein n=1 Tax=Haladaptatus halobius TaxID=2884875 RepID=UPI001D0A7A81|nr:hypothetical protein [Haladaptatus halobius]